MSPPRSTNSPALHRETGWKTGRLTSQWYCELCRNRCYFYWVRLSSFLTFSCMALNTFIMQASIRRIDWRWTHLQYDRQRALWKSQLGSRLAIAPWVVQCLAAYWASGGACDVVPLQIFTLSLLCTKWWWTHPNNLLEKEECHVNFCSWAYSTVLLAVFVDNFTCDGADTYAGKDRDVREFSVRGVGPW